MERVRNLMRPEIVAMHAYSSARLEQKTVTAAIQLNANESPFPPYPGSEKTIGLNRYPEPQPQEIIEQLSAVYDVMPEDLLVTRGMDEGIDLVIRLFCRPREDRILIMPPTFSYYGIAATVAGVGVVSCPLEEDKGFAVNTELVLAAWTPDIKIIFICTPNNPTGTSIPPEEISCLCKQLSGRAIVVVDEAYIEFSDFPSMTQLLKKFPNLIVMRTLSKAFALAGARLGAVCAHPEIIRELRKICPPYPISQPTINAVTEALSPFGLALTQDRVKFIKEERARLFTLLKDIAQKGAEIEQVYPSDGNFLLLKVLDAKTFYNRLLSQGIIVRDRSADINSTIRISIGTLEENNLLLNALGPRSEYQRSMRQADVARKTQETEVFVSVNLDQSKPLEISTGIGFFDHMLEQLGKHSGISLTLRAKGDLHIDTHHTVEDVAIVLGQALKKALGTRTGIMRYGFVLPMDEALVKAAIDLSGRGVFVFTGAFPTDQVGELPTEMVKHFFLTFAQNLGAAIHIEVQGENTHHMVEGCFKAVGKALGQACQVSPCNDVPSTKGVL